METGLPTPSTSAESEAHAAQLFDGETAARRLVRVTPWAGGLQLSGGADLLLARAELRLVSDGGQRTVLGRFDNPDWRLVAEPPLPCDWLKGVARADAVRPRDLRLLVLGLGGAAAVVAMMWLWGGVVLAAAAPLVPDSVTGPLGKGMVAQLVGDRACESPAADAALARLTARIGAPRPLNVTVADWPFANAFAGPGGEIVLTRGLIETASGPDEVAGVLAHEMGHVAHHHPTKALLRYYGVSLLAGSLGGRSAELADVGLALASTRDAEREADAHALKALAAADVSTAGLSAFFERQMKGGTKPDGQAEERLRQVLAEAGSWARTHPPDAERLETIRAAGVSARTRPAMTAADWAALKAACLSRPVRAGD